MTNLIAMKNIFTRFMPLVALLLLAFTFGAIAQEETEEEEKDKRPVRAPFESSILLENQTVVVPSKGTMQFEIQHRFGTLENGISDFFGMWAPSNIRLGMSYAPVDDIILGVGGTKFNKFVDLNYKWNFVKQTRSWSMPVGLTFFGYAAIDTRGNTELEENFVYRMSYFNELIIATRFNHNFSLQVIPSFTHFNAVDSLYNNDTWAVTLSGRYKITAQTSFVFQYDQPLTTHDAVIDDGDGGTKSLPLSNLTLGFEISTSTHAFQIFVGNSQEILYHKNIAFNQNDFTQGDILIGFNITRLWNF